MALFVRCKYSVRAASFDGKFALLVARHLYFVTIVLLHLANRICSVLYQSIMYSPADEPSVWFEDRDDVQFGQSLSQNTAA